MLPITITICLTVIVVALVAAQCYGERVHVLKVQLADAQRLLVRAERDRKAEPAVSDPVLGATVALALPGGEMIRGQFAGGDTDTVLLDRAELIAGGAVQPLGGRQTVKRGAWMQDFGLSEPVSVPAGV